MSPYPTAIEHRGEEVTFEPQDGSGPFQVLMIVSTNAPDPDVQPAPILVLFGTLDDSGFTDQAAPRPKKGDEFTVDGLHYECYLVKQDRASATPQTAGNWCYLTQVGG